MQTISVKGIGRASAPPDQVDIELKIEATGKELDKAKNACVKQFEALKRAFFIRRCNDYIEMEEGRPYCEPVHLPDDEIPIVGDGPEYRNGFKCWEKVSLSFDYDEQRFSTIVSILAKYLSNPIVSIAFSVKDQALVDKAYQLAVKDAERKAEIICKMAGKKLGNVAGFNFPWNDDEFDLPNKEYFQYKVRSGPLSNDFQPADIYEVTTFDYKYDVHELR